MSNAKPIEYFTSPARDVELDNLRQRVKRQRAEIRRLNKHWTFWEGYRRGIDTRFAAELRAKMISAFGADAVRKAEGE